jgi:hypothetical protein
VEAILLALHKGSKVENNFRAFWNGESEFYDLYRRFLDTPQRFGATREEQLGGTFEMLKLTTSHHSKRSSLRSKRNVTANGRIEGIVNPVRDLPNPHP